MHRCIVLNLEETIEDAGIVAGDIVQCVTKIGKLQNYYMNSYLISWDEVQLRDW